MHPSSIPNLPWPHLSTVSISASAWRRTAAPPEAALALGEATAGLASVASRSTLSQCSCGGQATRAGLLGQEAVESACHRGHLHPAVIFLGHSATPPLSPRCLLPARTCRMPLLSERLSPWPHCACTGPPLRFFFFPPFSLP